MVNINHDCPLYYLKMIVIYIILVDEEQDMKLAIELSLRDSHSEPGAKPDSPALISGLTSATLCSRDISTDRSATRSPSGEHYTSLSQEYSTIVTRVPNKSIEDLAIIEGSLSHHQSASRHSSDQSSGQKESSEPISPHRITLKPNQIYFPGRVQEPGQIRFQGPKYHFLENVRKGQNPPSQGHVKRPNEGRLSPRLQQNAFGVIKDISVNNIIAFDTDKTKDFSDKDFSQGFVKKNICDSNIEAVVFEPRPCPALLDRTPHWHLTQPTRHWSRPVDYAYEPGEDPWLRHSDIRKSNPLSPPATVSPRPSYPRTAPTAYSSSGHTHSTLQSIPTTHTPHVWPTYNAPHYSGQVPRIPNPEESLDHALQNLTDLTRHLTRGDSIDSVDMVIDSKVLESLLQGAEGYAKEGEGSGDLQTRPGIDQENVRKNTQAGASVPQPEDIESKPIDIDTELFCMDPPPVDPGLLEYPGSDVQDPLISVSDRPPTPSPPSTDHIPLILHLNQLELEGLGSQPDIDDDNSSQDRDAIYV